MHPAVQHRLSKDRSAFVYTLVSVGLIVPLSLKFPAAEFSDGLLSSEVPGATLQITLDPLACLPLIRNRVTRCRGGGGDPGHPGLAGREGQAVGNDCNAPLLATKNNIWVRPSPGDGCHQTL